MMKYDIDKLNALPVEEVIEALGGRFPRDHRPGRMKFNMHCFGPSHKNGDRNPSLFVNRETNYCKCFVCGDEIQGGPVALAKRAKGGFKEGCEWLHESFGIPYFHGKDSPGSIRAPRTPAKVRKESGNDYMRFDKNRPVERFQVKDLVARYGALSAPMKMKTVYTFVYRFSLQMDQGPKISFHQSRGIDTAKAFELKRIGYLSPEDIQRLKKLLVKYFPVEDLVSFNLFNAADSEYRPLDWKHWSKGGLCVVPNEDLYADLVHGLKLRKVGYEGKNKEPEVSRRDLVATIPFGLTRDLLMNRQITLIATEGYIDGLSCGKKFIAFPGVNGYNPEVLGLLEGRDIVICFDQDEAGRNGAEKLKKALEDAGARAAIREWNTALGGDLNELLINGNLDKVMW